jgi:hypothetical protein
MGSQRGFVRAAKLSVTRPAGAGAQANSATARLLTNRMACCRLLSPRRTAGDKRSPEFQSGAAPARRFSPKRFIPQRESGEYSK